MIVEPDRAAAIGLAIAVRGQGRRRRGRGQGPRARPVRRPGRCIPFDDREVAAEALALPACGRGRTRDGAAAGRARRRTRDPALARATSPRSPAPALDQVADPARHGHRPGGHRLPRRPGPGALFAALPGEPGRRARLRRRRRWPRARPRCSPARPVGVPALIVAGRARPRSASLARAVVDRLPSLDDRRDHRLGGQDHHQGPGRPAGRARSGPTVAPRGLVQQRDRPPADRAARHRGHPLPGAGAVRPRGPGTSPQLCEIAPPRLGVVLCVGHAHAGEFGSIEAVAEAKGELPAALPAGRRRAAQRRRPAGAGHGRADRGAGGHVRPVAAAPTSAPAESGSTSAGRPGFTLVTPAGHRRRCSCGCSGAHNVTNALAAAALAGELGMPAGRDRRAAVRGRSRAAGGGWRSPSGRTGSP